MAQKYWAAEIPTPSEATHLAQPGVGPTLLSHHRVDVGGEERVPLVGVGHVGAEAVLERLNHNKGSLSSLHLNTPVIHLTAHHCTPLHLSEHYLSHLCFKRVWKKIKKNHGVFRLLRVTLKIHFLL